MWPWTSSAGACTSRSRICARFGCREEDLRAGVGVGRTSAKLLTFQCERARQYYRRAEQALPKRDARGMVAARIMAAIYFDLLKTIERANYDVFSGRIRVPARGRRSLRP